MEVTCKTKMMLIPGEFLGRNVDLLGRCIDQLGVPLLEHLRKGNLFFSLLGMLEHQELGSEK